MPANAIDSHQQASTRDRQKTARVAGALYLIVVVSGIVSLAYVPSQISTKGDAATAVGNIVAHELLFRIGIVAGLICYVFFLLLPLALYRLLGPVNKQAAALMVALALVSVPISLLSVSHKLEIVSLLSGPDQLRTLDPLLLNHVMLLLTQYRNGLLTASIFWGLWLLPFGYLVFKSNFLPKILGILLMIGCFGDLTDVIGNALFSWYGDTRIADLATLPGSIGEIGICLWLLTIGVREPKLNGGRKPEESV